MTSQLDALVGEFEAASSELARLRRTLPDDAWGRRPAPGRWSAAECIAHLNLTAEAFLPVLREGLDAAARRGRTPAARYRLDPLGWLIRLMSGPSRRFKVKTAAPFVPSGDRPLAELLAEFERLQQAQVALVREADGLPIDRVRVRSPFDARVSYSVFSALSILPRHQQRHLRQAAEAASI